MSSRRDQIIDVLFAVLSGAGKPSGLTVSRSRTTAFASTQLPGQALYLVAEEIVERAGRSLDNKLVVKRRLRLAVETRVSSGSDTPDQAIDPYLTWAVQALCANPTVKVGANDPLAHDVLELGTSWSSEETDAVYAGATQFFQVEYVTSGMDPDAATAG